MSSTLLDARQITRRYGARTILEDIDVQVNVGDRIGLIGRNGAGKSTLLRILARREPPDQGTVNWFGTVGLLPQVADANQPHVTVRQLILERVGVAPAAGELEHWDPHSPPVILTRSSPRHRARADQPSRR